MDRSIDCFPGGQNVGGLEIVGNSVRSELSFRPLCLSRAAVVAREILPRGEPVSRSFLRPRFYREYLRAYISVRSHRFSLRYMACKNIQELRSCSSHKVPNYPGVATLQRAIESIRTVASN